MLRRGGAGLARSVGRRGGDGQAAFFDEGVGHRVGGHTHAHGVEAGGDVVRHRVLFGQHQGQRAGPELFRQLFAQRREAAHLLRHGPVAHVDDEGVVLGTALGLEDAGHGLRVAGVGAQAVHGLGGESAAFALADQLRRAGQPRFVRGQNLGLVFFEHNISLR